jgi:iron(III) transport system substrate-binding protein
VNDPALIAAAKAEGQLQVYGVGPATALAATAQRFETTYGIRVSWLHVGGVAMPARLLVEQRGGNPKTDVVTTVPTLQTEQIKRAGLYAQYRPPEDRDLLPQTFDPDGNWSGNEFLTESICYNPARVKAAGLQPPTAWADFTAKEWRGKFAFYAGSWEWYAAMKRFFGPARAEALARAYAANAPRMEVSHQNLVDLTAAGDVIAAANAFGHTCLRAKDQGAPVELVNPVPTVIELGTIGVLRAAPHPNAARLYVRWLLSRETAQWSYDSLGVNVPRKDVKTDPRIFNARTRSVISNLSDLDTIDADMKAYNAIFNIPG